MRSPGAERRFLRLARRSAAAALDARASRAYRAGHPVGTAGSRLFQDGVPSKTC
jgi:hypothetical protein